MLILGIDIGSLEIKYFLIDLVDIFCYVCDDMKQDPEVGTHLATFGVKLAEQSKTEKSMAELVC
jgi:uncharacterized UBP type Zn finger protein